MGGRYPAAMGVIDRDDPLEQPFFLFSELADIWAGRDAVEGTAIIGASGSGKTSAAGRSILVNLLRAGLGGFVIAAKATDADDWREYLRQACRDPHDLIHFSPTSGHRFDGLSYLWSRPGGRMLENLIEVIRILIEIANPHAGSGGDRFFDLAANQLVRNMIVLRSLAKQPVSITSINDLIDALPTVPGQFEEVEFQSQSELPKVLDIIRKRRKAGELSEAEWDDFAAAQYFALIRWPALYPETRTSVHATWSGLADQFLFHPLREAFSSSQCTFVPEQAEIGKVILCDWPALTLGETGRIIGCLLKVVFQIAWTKRVITRESPLVFFASDEAPIYLLPGDKDSAFQAVCRGSRVATVFMLQTILGVASRLGEHQPGSKTKGWLSNVATKIFLQNSCIDTNTYAADLIGKEYRMAASYTSGQQNATAGGHEHLDYIVQPHEFMRLTKPSAEQPIAEAILVRGGTPFRATQTPQTPQGHSFLRIGFSRESD